MKKSVIFIVSLLLVALYTLPAHAGSSHILGSNQSLAKNGSIVSKDGRYKLVLQEDGNVVLYKGKTAVWSTKTQGKAVTKLTMQTDGNLVLYGFANKAVWSSKSVKGTAHTYKLFIQNDGNLVIYNSRGKATWSSKTHEKN